jgi:Protein of unknown function (DUF3011)
MSWQGPASALVLLALVVAPSRAALAQTALTPGSDPDAPGDGATAVISCTSDPGGRTQCPATTAAGVVLVRTTGSAACTLGHTWGYDQTSVWVSDGCGGEFLVGRQAVPAVPPPADQPPEREPTPRNDTWGDLDPGRGFLIGRTSAGELAVSAYAVVRYMNQMPDDETFTDHLGQERRVDGRHDIYPHRVLVWLKGWVGVPKLVYTVTLWTVNTTDQDAIFGNIGYQFSPRFNLYAGINGNPGTRSMQGSHPFWLGHDRVMADEFFRPFFGSGAYVQGEAVRGLWYNAMIGNSNSALGIRATQLDRRFTTGGSVWWMPTTKEFGPRGAFGDWEQHEQLATRFGVSTTQSREERYTDPDNFNTGNTTLRLADGLNVFETGTLAPGITVDQVDYRILSFDAGIKYKGLFLQTEIYSRWLDNFVADGPLPVASIFDRGFYFQGSFYPIPRKLELYGVTSQIFGDEDAGFDHSDEYGGGFNYYPADTRNHRFNLQVLRVNGSPVSSTFGYYVGGQTGTTLSAAFSVFF